MPACLRQAIYLGPADAIIYKLIAAPHSTPRHPTPHLDAVCAGSPLRDAQHLAQGIAKEEAA